MVLPSFFFFVALDMKLVLLLFIDDILVYESSDRHASRYVRDGHL